MLSIDEQKSLITRFVKSNKNFAGNEDLFEDFCSESLQKSYMIFNSENSVQKLESYVSKVVHTSILVVLKNYGRIRRDKTGYVATKEVKIDDIQYHQEKMQLDEKSQNIDVSLLDNGTGISFILEFPDPKETAEDILITKECLVRVANSVCIIHKESPSEQFFDIFYLRYMKGCKQSEIAKQLGLSQSEVSKRLMRLSKLISNVLDVTKG